MTVTDPDDAGEELETQSRGDLETRIELLERHIATLTAAVDAASRLRIASRVQISPDLSVAGGKKVRRILEKGGLVSGYPEVPRGD